MSRKDVRRDLVNGAQGRSEQHLRFVIACGPTALAIHTLPGDLELLVDQHNRLGTAAPRTRHTMLVEHVWSGKSSWHVQLVGFSKLMR